MFEKRLLKELKDVQENIKICEDNIANLDPPKADNYRIRANIRKWIESSADGLNPKINTLFHGYPEDEAATYEYLRKLGEFLINMADYNNKRQKYDMRLCALKLTEKDLKERLGIK